MGRYNVHPGCHPLHRGAALQKGASDMEQQVMGHILVVDDDVAIRHALTEFLEEEGYATSTAANGQEALRYIENTTPPCVILLDLMMPVMNGYDFFVTQQHDPVLRHIPVVVLSAYSFSEHVVTPLDAAAFLPKPVDIQRLLGIIARFWHYAVVTFQ